MEQRQAIDSWHIDIGHNHIDVAVRLEREPDMKVLVLQKFRHQIGDGAINFLSALSGYGWSTAAEDKPAAQMELLTKATAINPSYAFAYYVKSTASFIAKEYPASLAAAQTEVALDPNSAYGYSAIGRAEGLLGRCEQSIAHIKQAFALSPREPFSGIWYMHLGLAEICRGRLDAAIEEFKRAVPRKPELVDR